MDDRARPGGLVLRGPHEAREVRPLGLWEWPGWRVKGYRLMERRRKAPTVALLAAARSLAAARLAAVPPAEHHGAGFAILHLARPANFLLLDWWGNENTLYQALYRAELDRPADFAPLDGSAQVACVWELRVQCFEREAWLDTVLANPAGPDVDAYLDRRLAGPV